jgi:hypothetical protein
MTNPKKQTNEKGIEMQRKTVIGLAFLSPIIIGLIVTSVASAAKPEFEKAVNFTSIARAPATVFKSPSGSEVTCTISEIEKAAVITPGAKKAKNIQLNFKGCKSSGVECTTTGAVAGEIRSNTLEGELGYIEPGTEKTEDVAFALFPAVGTVIAEYTCKEADEEKGCIVSELKKANVESASFNLLFEEASGVQKLLGYEPTLGTPKECKLKVKIGAIEEGDALETSQTITIACPNMEKINS